MDLDSRQKSAMAEPTTAPTLGQLCANLGPLLTDLVVAPRGGDAPVRGVALADPSEGIRPDGAGRLVLAVGMTADDPRFVGFLRSAAAASAIAIAIRPPDDWPQVALDAAADSGVALVGISAHLAWDELYELIKAELSATGLEPATIASRLESQPARDLSSICDALSTIVGGAVGIEDMNGRILAFSGGGESDAMRTASILNRRVPEEWLREIRNSGVLDELFQSEDVVRANFDNLHPRRAIAIRLGNSVLGSIWVIGSEEHLADNSDEALRQTAPMVAREMVRQRLVVGVERRIQEASVESLLWGDAPSPRALEQVGLSADQELVVIAFEVVSRGTSSPVRVGPRMIDLLSVHLQAHERAAVSTSASERTTTPAVNERVYVLAASRGADDRLKLQRLAREFITQARRALGVELAAGIGPRVVPGGYLRLARECADDCIASQSSSGSVLLFEEIQDRALIRDVERFVSTWRGGPSRVYLTLSEHDEAHGTEYLLTLRCLFESLGSVAAVADRLQVHVSTIRYRIRRIVEISGLDISDGESRLALELTLRSLESSR